MSNVFLNKSTEVHFLHRQGGASLLEAIAYLGIAALVILGAVSLLTGAFGSAQSNRASEEIIALRTAARKLYTGQVGAYPPAMNAPLIAVNAIPGTLNVGTGGAAVIINSWGGPVTITGAGASFSISYANVPRDACISVLAGITGWTSVTIGVGGGNIPGPPNAAITPDAATTACAAATNTIVFTAS